MRTAIDGAGFLGTDLGAYITKKGGPKPSFDNLALFDDFKK